MTISLGPRPPRKLTETDIVGRIIIACNRMVGVRCRRNNVAMLPSAAGGLVPCGMGVGSPDVMGVITVGGINGAFRSASQPFAFAFGIEVKRPKESGGRDATRQQRAWGIAAQRRGIFWGVATSEDIACGLVAEWIEILYRSVRVIR